MNTLLGYDATQMPKRTMRFRLFSIQAHIGNDNPDYAQLFNQLAGLRRMSRIAGNRVIAAGNPMLTNGGPSASNRLFLTVYSGDNEKNITWFDLKEQAEITSTAEEGRFVAKKTYVLIDPGMKRIALEAGKGHPSADDLAEFLEDQARKLAGFEKLDLTFSPVAVPKFAQQIERLQRIQAASVVIARPNPDWTDRLDQLTQTANDSNAKVVETSVRAGRNEGLAKDAGLVRYIKEWVTGAFPSLKNAKLKGNLEGSSAPIELKLTDYIETASFAFDVDATTKRPLDSEIQKGLHLLLDTRKEEKHNA